MVWVELGRTEGVKQTTEFSGTVIHHPDREVGPAKGRQQLEPCVSESACPGQVDGTVGGEALKEPLQR